jgi:hypothetical protein
MLFFVTISLYGRAALLRYYGNRKPSCSYTDIFSQAKDITELGTLKEASKLFVPGDFCRLNLKTAPFL